MKSTTVEIDVSNALPFGSEVNIVRGTVHYPSPGADIEPANIILMCWAGGSYAREYWDLRYKEGFSAAEYWTSRGFVVVVGDHLGTGTSSQPAEGDDVSIVVMAAAADRFCRDVRDQLSAGLIDGELSAMPDALVVGVGHSLGGWMVVAQQAEHQTYDLICPIGHTSAQKAVVADQMGVVAEDPRDVAVAQTKLFFKDTWDDVYGETAKHDHVNWLYGPTDDAEVIAQDVEISALWPRRIYIDSLLPNASAAFAPRITVPLLISFAEVDIPEVPRLDVAFYTGSNDISLFLLQDAGHCSNFSPNRHQLWDRIDRWARSYV